MDLKIIRVLDHYEVYDGQNFLFSADNMAEVNNELKEMS